MATANEYLFDELVQRAIDLDIYSDTTSRKMIRLLNRADSELFAELTKALDKLPASQFNVSRLTGLLSSVRLLNKRLYEELSGTFTDELEQMTALELSFQESALKSVLPEVVTLSRVSVDTVHAAAMARPFQGKLLREWMKGLEADRAVKIRDAVRMGYIEGETTEQIVRRIRGTRALKYRDGVLDISRRNARTVIRTAINHTGNYARTRLYERNSDIVKGVRFTATLDLRTTAICRSLDGEIYPLKKKRPAIPQHMNCRSLYVPILWDWKKLGLNPSNSTRSSLDGQVPSDQNYEQWLRKQSVERQNDVLGVTKAKLFRQGGLSLDKFVSKQGVEYTLEDLAKRHPAVYERVVN